MAKEDPYLGIEPANCMPDNCFCEAIHYGSWIRQPANTWSNLAFIAVALGILWILYRNRTDRSNLLLSHPVYTWLFAFGCTLTGLGSFYYHASFTLMGQWFDMMGMYFSITFFTIYNIDRLYGIKPVKFISLYLATNLLLCLFLTAVPEVRRYLFAAFVLLFLASIFYTQNKLKTKINAKYLFWSMFSFGLAFALWILDIKKIVCAPNSLWQLHSIWHLLTALSGLLIYLYYFSEDNSTAAEDGELR
jgi:hypothetical protein